jgi:hypothetical protein
MFNADPVKLIQFLDIGTRTDNLRWDRLYRLYLCPTSLDFG